MPRTVERPSPVPWPGSLVVKKGSKMRSATPGSMPHPVSDTATRTCGPLISPELVGEIRVARDRGEQVVEVVRDAARELPDRFHALRAPKLFLQQLALADVLHHADRELRLAARIGQGERRQLRRENAAVLPDVALLQGIRG